MRFIVENKVYDTDRATLISKGVRSVTKISALFGFSYQDEIKTTLYRSVKGTYFFVDKADYDQSVISITGEGVAKSFLIKNNYDKYVELFGELEEG